MPTKSGFQFKDFVVSKSLFFRGTHQSKNDFDFHIDPSGIVDNEGKTFQLTFNFQLSEEKENLLINVECTGFFNFSGVYEDAKPFFLLNAPAIMFPYLRSYIAGMTALSGIDTITIPTLNLTSMKERLEKNISLINTEVE